SRYRSLGTGRRDERCRISSPRFAPGLDRVEGDGVGILSEAVQVIRIDPVTFPAKHTTESQPYAAGRQIKQVSGVNVQVQCGEFRRKQLPRVQPREVNQRKVARKRDMLAIDYRIIWNRLSNELTRRGIKQRVGRI